jgi:type IX secretion system PorP/SprF family membrane protein
MGGVVFQHFDPSKLSFDDQFVNGAYSSSNPTRQIFTNTSTMYWDLSAGLSFSSVMGQQTHYYLGFGLFHILQPKVAFQKQYDVFLNRKWMVNAGLSIPFSDINKLIIYADYFMQGGNRQGQSGLLVNHDLSQLQDNKIGISGGLFYRWNDALVPLVKIDYYSLGLGMSYDVNISKLKNASQNRGGFELTFSYKTYRQSQNSSLNKVKCPAF